MKHSQVFPMVFFFSGFPARSCLQGIFGDLHAWLVTLVRHRQCLDQVEVREAITEYIERFCNPQCLHQARSSRSREEFE